MKVKWMVIWFIFVALVQLGIVVYQTVRLNKLIDAMSTKLEQVKAYERCLLEVVEYIPACQPM
jgi:hypothetical protein